VNAVIERQPKHTRRCSDRQASTCANRDFAVPETWL